MLTEETVTTVDYDDAAEATLSYAMFIDADEIVVTFDGTEYRCPKRKNMIGNSYGAAEAFSEYPFVIQSQTNGENRICTETAGTHSVKIEVDGISVGEVSECFRSAVQSVSVLVVKPVSVTNADGTVTITTDKSMVNVLDAFGQGIPCYITFDPTANMCGYHSLSDIPKVMYPIVAANEQELSFTVSIPGSTSLYTVSVVPPQPPIDPITIVGQCAS